MKTVTERTTTTVVKDVRICCDVCGKGGHDRYDSEVSWFTESCYDVARTTIMAAVGEQYPEFGTRKVKSAHICNKCMDEKVWPFLESIMKTPPTEEEIDV